MDSEDASNRCLNCNSHKTVVKASHPSNNLVVVNRHCTMCRHDTFMWSGTKGEYKKYLAQQRGIARKLKRAAARVCQTGDGDT